MIFRQLGRRIKDEIDKRRRVNSLWYYKLKLKNKFSKKIKVGFGPILERENTLGNRKYRIDPVVETINKLSEKYSAGIFINPNKVNKFDIIVIVKIFDNIQVSMIDFLRKGGKVFIYDIVDNPYWFDNPKTYDKSPEFIKRMDGIIASSPLHINDLEKWNQKIMLIEHPVINTKAKNYKKANNDDVRIIIVGYWKNLECMDFIQPIVKKLSKELDKNIKLIYHSDRYPRKTNSCVEYIAWSIKSWQDVLINCDIGITAKPLNDYYQQRKPSTKVLTYMAAGLPVICAPSPADKLTIKHGVNGYFAHTNEEWYLYLKTLIKNVDLRKKIGEAGRECAINNFNLETITQKYLVFFDKTIQHAV